MRAPRTNPRASKEGLQHGMLGAVVLGAGLGLGKAHRAVLQAGCAAGRQRSGLRTCRKTAGCLVGLQDSAIHVRRVQRERRPERAVAQLDYAAEPGHVTRRRPRQEGPALCQEAPCFLRGALTARTGEGSLV